MIAADVVFTYHVAAVGFMANGLFLTTSSINALIYSPDGASEAAAAGFILLAIVMAIWIFYFGSQPQASHRRFIDSFALHKSNDESLRASRMPTSQNFGPSNPGFPTSNPTQSAAFSSNHLRGLETSSPLTATNNSTFMSESQPRFGGPTNNNTLSSTMPYQDVTQHEAPGVPAPTEYPYKARAIYSYEANPDDANEISFQKHEILEVSDVSGRWWQAKKSSGETGIAPSNYLILL
ncbi:hypothetical protein FH972_025446 [Carpinus fangiana]|nr:hypothetical protein FH972_025446 [Carpinus fangiana]